MHTSTTRRLLVRGADDQAAAYRALRRRYAESDAQTDEQEWALVERGLQETRRALDQRLFFPE